MQDGPCRKIADFEEKVECYHMSFSKKIADLGETGACQTQGKSGLYFCEQYLMLKAFYLIVVLAVGCFACREAVGEGYYYQTQAPWIPADKCSLVYSSPKAAIESCINDEIENCSALYVRYIYKSGNGPESSTVTGWAEFDMRCSYWGEGSVVRRTIWMPRLGSFCNANNCMWRCPNPSWLSVDNSQCEAYCTTGETWDPLTERCTPSPQEQSCKTQGKSPIDFIEGRKYRSEPVLSSGVRYPFSLVYYFNNQRNQEKSPVGSTVAVVTGDRYLAATKPPMTASEYQSSYTSRGVPVSSTVYKTSQHYGSVDQYWRHNFDEVLLVQGGQYRYQSARGEEIVLNGLGNSAAYPSLVLEALTSGEETFAGYKLTNRQSREVREFDENGRLIKLERTPQDVLVLTYDSQNRLDRITNTEGAYIQLTYQGLATNSVYSIDPTSHSYPVSASNNRSESSQITWGKSYQGKTATFHLITRITEATIGTAQSARTFEYNDTRWPASITDQYFIADISNSANKKQLLHFDYDELGRAVFSGLEGRPSDTVNYVDANTRVVTNALGKQATYTFADFDGIKRLQSVAGEPTQNCVSSEVTYEYDANGNVSRKTQNGQVTEYLYDSQNRETSRTEAAGTREARTVTTEYHPTLNQPVKIIEPGQITEMTYDDAGHLLSTQRISR